MILNRALVRNVGTCRPDAKGGIQAGGPPRAEYRWAQGRSSNSGEALLLCNGAGPKGLHCSAEITGQLKPTGNRRSLWTR